MPRLISIGDLVQSGEYLRLSRSRGTVHFTDGVRVVALGGPDMDPGPINIAVGGLGTRNVRRLRVDARGGKGRTEVERGRIVIDSCELPYGDERVYISSIRLRRRNPDAFLGSLGNLGALLVELSPQESLSFLLDYERLWDLDPGCQRDLARHITQCVRDILHGDRLRGIERLRCCRIGDSASGTDFLEGFLVGLNVLEKLGTRESSLTRWRVLQAARRGGVLTDARLYLAEEGRVERSMKMLISAIEDGAVGDIRSWTERLIRRGGAGGADVAIGFYAVVRTELGRRLRRTVRWQRSSHTTCRYDVV